MENKKWISIKNILPKEGQEIYYFCNFLGIFKGEYQYIERSYGNSHKFISKHGILDADDVSHWMPYDDSLKDVIPLPPNYKKIDINRRDSNINIDTDSTYDEVDIPEESRQLKFSYEIIGEI